MMREFDKRLYRTLLRGGVTAVVAGGVFATLSSAAFAQSVDQASDVEEVQAEEIVITGSRIRRDPFNSTTPIQVLDVEEASRLGVSSISDLLQRSTAASGAQIDATLNTNAGNSNATEAPPTGGIGSSNINLRNLGVERTLVLVNGRRLGAAGVRGAPAQPDINLIPFAMVETVDILTGGLSTVYGADAVAGVVNVKLREDFDGIQVGGNVQLAEHDGGNLYQTSIVTGVSNDRGNITLGFEYSKRERVSTGDRNFSRCLREIELDENGNEAINSCQSGFFDNVIVTDGEDIPGLPGSLGGGDTFFVFYTPGRTDIGVDNFSSALGIPQPADPNVSRFPIPGVNNARTAFIYNDFYNDQDERRRADLVRPQERFSLVANGHLDLDWGNDERLYFESYYFNRTNNVIAATEQIFPSIAAYIPTVDENDQIIRNPDGTPVLARNPLNPFSIDVAPILTLADLPQEFDVEVSQFRGVLGFDGKIGGGWFEENDWGYDTYFTYDRGVGFQSQTVLLEDRLIEATQTLRLDPDGNVRCGFPLPANGNGFITPNECVPVNFFASSIFENGEGRFATDAEREFLLGRRTNRTVTQQYNAALFLNGDLFSSPWGDKVGAAFGVEWRRDTIASQNGAIGSSGLNAAENPLSEGETTGSRWIYDLYAEFSAPIITNKKFIELLQLDAAVRYTEEENFGSEVTYRIAGLYRPLEYISIGGSFNTSFRAPNLREQFLADQFNGIGGNNDPCLAQNIGQLDPSDPTTQRIIDNCVASGADINVLGTGGVTTIPVRVGGSTDLVAEEADTYTATLQLSQPWFDNFDFDLAVTYFNIEITNTVEELEADVIIGRCYRDEPNLASPFCRRVSRPTTGAPSSRVINSVDASFINVGLLTSKGFDISGRLRYTVDEVLGDPLDVTWAVSATRQTEQVRQVFSDSAAIDNLGRIGSPKWLVQSTVNLGWDRYSFLWQTRYIGRTEYAPNQVDPEEPFADNPNFVGNTLTRDDEIAERKIYNDVSMSADFDQYSLTFGVRNLLDVKPPLIDDSEGPQRNNAVSSSGFDFIGRTFFLNGTIKF